MVPLWKLFPAVFFSFVACVEIAGAGDAKNVDHPLGHASTRISAGRIERHIGFLASEELEGRSGKGAQRAAEHLKEHFTQLGLEPLFDTESYIQRIPTVGKENGRSSIAGRNVGGLIRGSDPAVADELVIVSAHFDHLGVRDGKIYRGADDNASGVAMLMEVARHMAAGEVRCRRSVAFVGFDLEERMLWGSRWFVAHSPWPLEKIRLFMTADMIGRTLGDLPLPVVFVLGSEHAPQLRQMLDAAATPKQLEVARLGVDLIGTRSDYGPFRDRKIPFLFFSCGQHPDYHTPGDIPERVDCQRVARVSELVLRVCTEAVNSDAPVDWTDDVQPDLDEAKTLNRIAGLLLEGDIEPELGNLQRFVVSQARAKTQQIIDRGEMTAGERTWLARMSQLLLLSVF